MKTKLWAAFAAVCVLLSAASCSRTPGMLGTIPADAPGVVTFDAERLMNAMNGVAYGGKLTAEQTLGQFLAHASEKARTEITALLTSHAIDRHLMAGFAVKPAGADLKALLSTGTYVYTFSIDDVSRLLSDMGVSGTPQSLKGFDVYALEDVNLLVKGKQGWLMAGKPDRAAAMLDDELSRAANTSIADIKGINKFLTDHGDILRVAIASTGLDRAWTCITADISDDGMRVEIDAEYIDADGNEADMSQNLARINTSLLDYTMPSDVMVACVGIKENTDWEALVEYFNSVSPVSYRSRAMMSLVIPYLKRIDGTVMVAAGPTLDDRVTTQNFSNDINFVVAVQMKKSDVKQTLKDISDMSATLGLPLMKKDDGYVWQAPGMAPVTLKVTDGNCLVLTNRPLSQLGNKAASKVMKGNVAGLWANVPNALGESTYGGRGFNIMMEVDKDFDMEFSFNGATAPLLEELSGIVAAD